MYRHLLFFLAYSAPITSCSIGLYSFLLEPFVPRPEIYSHVWPLFQSAVYIVYISWFYAYISRCSLQVMSIWEAGTCYIGLEISAVFPSFLRILLKKNSYSREHMWTSCVFYLIGTGSFPIDCFLQLDLIYRDILQRHAEDLLWYFLLLFNPFCNIFECNDLLPYISTKVLDTLRCQVSLLILSKCAGFFYFNRRLIVYFEIDSKMDQLFETMKMRYNEKQNIRIYWKKHIKYSYS